MISLRAVIAALIGVIVAHAAAERNLVCYYDSSSYLREGFAKLRPDNLEMALQFCTHLVYGYAGLKPTTLELFSLNEYLDMFYYAEITLLKAKYPHLKVYLSVGGDKDIDDANPLKYLGLLEATREQQQNFIDSSVALLRHNGFDGLDLAFQLPRNKPRKVHGALGTWWKKFKKLFTGDFIVDEKTEEHKRQYTELAKNIRGAFKYSNLSLTMTVLPNVNSTWYFDPSELIPHFEFVNLAAFDFLTPQRNPDEADFTAPIHSLSEQNRLPHYNIEFQVNYWLNNFWPPSKLNLGIASYGRAWLMTTASGLSGMPVVEHTDGPAAPGLQTNTSGLLSWPEICGNLPNTMNKNFRGPDAPLRKVTDLEQKHGNYALRPADENGEHGVWVSYDDPDMATVKANYARDKGLGGVALFDLAYDDFRGLCTGNKYPFLRSIKSSLN